MFNLFLICFCVYFPRILYALPSPQQGATLVFFGSDSDFLGGDDTDSDNVVTQFLVPSGTSSGGDQTTFEYVEVDSTVIESLSGTATVTQTSLTTFTAELVASASGFVIDGTVTEVVSGTTTVATFTEACGAAATNNGECQIELDGIGTLSITGTAGPQLIAVSGAPTAAPSSASSSLSISVSSNGSLVSPTSGSSKNGGFKREFNQKMLAGLAFSTTILGICFGGFLVI